MKLNNQRKSKENLPTRKEKKMFFASAIVSISGSLIAGLTGAAFYDLVNVFGLGKGWRIGYAFFFAILFISIILWLAKKTK